MTYLELQKALKEFRYNGTELLIKLNATKEALQAEYDRLTIVIVDPELVIESVTVEKIVTEVKEETNDNYWVKWNRMYKTSLQNAMTTRSNLILERQSKSSQETHDDLEHEQLGLVLVAACYMLFEMTFTELSKTYQFIYGVLQKTNNKRLFPIFIRVDQNAIQ
jgi:hypothetical protein